MKFEIMKRCGPFTVYASRWSFGVTAGVFGLTIVCGDRCPRMLSVVLSPRAGFSR